MDAQTYSLLSALGTPESLQIVVALLEEADTVEGLARRTEIPSATVSRRLDALAAVGVVARASPRGPYQLTHEQLTRNVAETLSELSTAVLQSRLDAEKALQRRIQRTRLRQADVADERGT